MRIPLTLCALVLAGLVAAPAARALEDAKPPSGEARVTVPVVLVLPGGQRLEGTLLEGSKDGSLKVKTSYAEQTFERKDWVQVSARQRPTEFTIAEQLLQSKRYKAAAGKYQAIYDTYEHLYIFGADALDGKGQALMGLDSYKKALEAY